LTGEYKNELNTNQLTRKNILRYLDT